MGGARDLSRRGFLGAAAGTGAAAVVGVGAGSAAAGHGRPGPGRPGGGDLALVNGKIHTFDENNSVVSKLLIRDGRFVNVGGVGGGGGPRTTINLKGRTVIPGIIDNHCHFVRMGQAVGRDMRRLETAFSIEEAQEVIAQEAAEVPEGEFLTALAGIARLQFADPPRFPTLDELDEAAPHHPVVISELFAGQANSLGRDRLRELGVSVGDDGSVANQNDAYMALSPFLTPETKRRTMLAAAEYVLSTGLTTVMDDHGNFGEVGQAGFLDRVTGHDHLMDLWRLRELPVRQRLRFAVREGLDDPSLLDTWLNTKWLGLGDDMLQQSGIGEWAPRDDLYQDSLVKIANRSYTYHQHLIGTGEIQAHLDALSQYVADNPDLPSPGELHWSGGHMNGLTEAQVRQSNELGLGIAAHGGFRYLTSTQSGPNFRMILDLAEVPVGTGSDGARVAPINPWPTVYHMVTGRNSAGEMINDGGQISREEALRMYCGPQQGWFSREDDVLGGVVEGRYADLAVLSADVFNHHRVSDEQLRTMSSVMTIVGGQVRYDTGVL